MIIDMLIAYVIGLFSDFHAMIYYDFRHRLTQQQCVDQLALSVPMCVYNNTLFLNNNHYFKFLYYEKRQI